MAKIVAEARRSQLINTFGIGSIFPAPDQSLMICGLDDWSEANCQELAEPRLAESLGVARLLMPSAGRKYGDIPVVRFPRFYFCPECRRLETWRRFDISKDSPRCQKCERQAIPSRFVVACNHGHIDDFPYFRWVHAGAGKTDGEHRLFLETRGETSALADMIIRCSCGRSRSMDRAFEAAALREVTSCSCTGSRPWLPQAEPEMCTDQVRVLQRGGSSVWFANIRSAISIPPWSTISQQFKALWPMLKDADDETLEFILSKPQWQPKGGHWTVDRLVQIVQEARSGERLDAETLRRQEYDALMAGHPEIDPLDQFVCDEVEGIDPQVGCYVADVRRVSRLREVSALVSFSRIAPNVAEGASSLSLAPTDWVPAIEVFGEGIFINLEAEGLNVWATLPEVQERVARIRAAAEKAHYPIDGVTARFLCLHSFAHVLMNELSLEAGYPVASLRERIYARDDESGILIYTATADSAGSLGGLCAQSDPDRLAAVIRSAMRRALWCTTDPVCLESTGSGIDNLNLAACHACMLVPETSCEHRNTLLDRALLIGLLEQPEIGFFSDIAIE